MTLFAVHYTYDDRSAARDDLRPQHRDYLRSLAARGQAPIFGRYDDDGQPGALIVLDAASADDARSLVAGDPFVVAGLVPEVSIREWPAIGPWVG